MCCSTKAYIQLTTQVYGTSTFFIKPIDDDMSKLFGFVHSQYLYSGSMNVMTEERMVAKKTNVVLFFKLSLLAVTLTFFYNCYGQNIQLCVFPHIMTHFL